MSRKTVGSLLVAALLATASFCTARAAETSVALNGYGWLNTTSNLSSGLAQIPANSFGAMLEVRRISSPLIGYEVTYGYNRDNQEYSNPISCAGASCPLAPYAASVSSAANQITGDWVLSLKIKRVHTFALAGAGIVMDSPSKGTLYSYTLLDNPAFTSTPAPTSSATSPAFVYGFGADWAVRKHIGVRFQYRGLMHRAPALTSSFASTKVFAQSYEPMVGVFYKF